MRTLIYLPGDEAIPINEVRGFFLPSERAPDRVVTRELRFRAPEHAARHLVGLKFLTGRRIGIDDFIGTLRVGASFRAAREDIWGPRAPSSLTT
jgi:hypothetical protein